MGIPAIVLTTSLQGEGREAGRFLASVAQEIQEAGNPVAAPCLVISAGEVSTKIGDSRLIRGHGGPSQEMVLGFALAAASVDRVALLSIDTEGTDGTTNVAGGLADSQSAARALRGGVDIYGALRGHASFEALAAIGDTIVTGNTGTNLCDLNIMYVPARESTP